MINITLLPIISRHSPARGYWEYSNSSGRICHFDQTPNRRTRVDETSLSSIQKYDFIWRSRLKFTVFLNLSLYLSFKLLKITSYVEWVFSPHIPPLTQDWGHPTIPAPLECCARCAPRLSWTNRVLWYWPVFPTGSFLASRHRRMPALHTLLYSSWKH